MVDPDHILAMLKTEPEAEYRRTNANAACSPHLKVYRGGPFHAATPDTKTDEDDPPDKLFPPQRARSAGGS